MAETFFQFLATQGFVTLFFVLGFGHLVGRLKLGFFSPGSTAGSLLVALTVGSLAFQMAGVRFAIPDLVQTIFLSLFTYAIGLRVGPQFVEGMRKQGLQLVVLVIVTTTIAFVMAVTAAAFLASVPASRRVFFREATRSRRSWASRPRPSIRGCSASRRADGR